MSARHPVDQDDIWIEQRRPVVPAERLLYCDRDGVLIHDRGYLSDPDGVELIDGIVEILAAAERAAIPVVVVTNQSGIGRGYFGWDAFAAVQSRMMALLGEAGIEPACVLACPHHAQAQPPYRHPDAPMRKPNPGMLLAAARLYGIDPAASLMIGDKADDMRAARRAGLRRGVRIDASAHREKASCDPFQVDRVASVREAVPVVGGWIDRPGG